MKWLVAGATGRASSGVGRLLGAAGRAPLLRNDAIMGHLLRYHADMTGEFEMVMDAIKAGAASIERE